MKSRGPPILPMYKAHLAQKKKSGGCMSICFAVLLPIFAVCLLVFFFLSIYMGSMYLQEHIEDESPNGILNKIGLPNTRNVIQKWSITNLHGVDLTKLGPPPKVIPQGLGTLHSQHHYLSNSSSEALQSFRHRIGDSLHHLYHNNASSGVMDGAYEAAHAGSAKLRGWLNSFHDLNTNSSSTYRIKNYLAEKTGVAMKSINELRQQGVKSVSELGLRGVQSLRGAPVPVEVKPEHSGNGTKPTDKHPSI